MVHDGLACRVVHRRNIVLIALDPHTAPSCPSPWRRISLLSSFFHPSASLAHLGVRLSSLRHSCVFGCQSERRVVSSSTRQNASRSFAYLIETTRPKKNYFSSGAQFLRPKRNADRVGARGEEEDEEREGGRAAPVPLRRLAPFACFLLGAVAGFVRLRFARRRLYRKGTARSRQGRRRRRTHGMGWSSRLGTL